MPTSAPPRPLSTAEHVLCTITAPSDDPPVHAIVVSLDRVYLDAAADYHRRNHPAALHTPTNTTNHNLHSPPHPLLFHQQHHPPSPTSSKRRRLLSTPPHPPHPPHPSHPPLSPLPPTNSPPNPHVLPPPHPITTGRVYVHFVDRDRRLDRWCAPSDLVRASASDITASKRIAATAADSPAAHVASASSHRPFVNTRANRRAYEEINPTSEKDMGSEAAIRMEKAREEMTKVRNISAIVLGDYVIDAWYFSPFPLKHPVDTLFMCGKCLKYLHTSRQFLVHCSKCDWIQPPGFRIYHDSLRNLSVYEVSAVVNPAYCQCLCLLGKLFLDHKTLFFDTSPFLFYVLTLDGQLAGYFSKEHPIVRSDHNLACILTLPHHQKKGVGRFLISLSYELTKREGKTAAPERPLSDLGQVSYRSYWSHAVLTFLNSKTEAITVAVKDIAEATAIQREDVQATLKHLNLVSIWKQETYADTNPKLISAAAKKISQPQIPLHQSCLQDSVYTAELPRPNTFLPRTPTPTTRRRPRGPQKSHEKSKRTPVSSSRPRGRPPKESTDASVKTRKLHDIIDRVGIEQVLARMNTADGMPLGLVKKLAGELNMQVKQFRKRLKHEAMERRGSVSIDAGSNSDSKQRRSLVSSDTPELIAEPETRRTNGKQYDASSSWRKPHYEEDSHEEEDDDDGDNAGQDPDFRLGSTRNGARSLLPVLPCTGEEPNGNGARTLDLHGMEEVTLLGHSVSNQPNGYRRSSVSKPRLDEEVIVVDQ